MGNRHVWLLLGSGVLVGVLWALYGRCRVGLLNFLLMNVAVMGKVRVVETLLAWGADPNATNRSYMSCQVVDEAGSVISSEPARQRLTTVLMLVASTGRTRVGEILIDHGAEVDAGDADGHTALIMATIMDEADVVQLLLNRGADVNARDAAGRTALVWARYLDKPQVRPVLEQAGGVE